MKSQVGPSTYQSLEDDWWSEARDALVRSLIPSDTSRVIDVGCGPAVLLRDLVGCFVIGVDGYFDQSWKVSESRSFVVADVTALPFKTGSVQVTTCLDVIEHQEDGDELLREIRRVTKARGTSIVTVPAGQYLWSSHDDEVGHFRRYGRKDFCAELAKNGFDLTDVGYLFSWLVLPAILRKLAGSSLNLAASSGLSARVARRLCRIEHRLIKFGFQVPFGTTLFARAVTCPTD